MGVAGARLSRGSRHTLGAGSDPALTPKTSREQGFPCGALNNWGQTPGFVEELAAARIGATFNQYAGSPLRRERLAAYLETRCAAPILLVGEAAGYRGARVSGIPFTSERQLTGTGPAEATATVVHRVLAELGLEEEVLLWNLVPTHPHRPGNPASNRAPTRAEIRAAAPFLEALAAGRRFVPVGRLAHRALGGPYVRHPAHGGAAAFRRSLLHFCAGGQASATPLL